MNSILLVFEKPDVTDQTEQKRWNGLSLNLKDLSNNNTDIQMLGENCLMLPINKGLDIFHKVLEPHRSLGVSYKYLILAEEPEWHVVSK